MFKKISWVIVLALVNSVNAFAVGAKRPTPPLPDPKLKALLCDDIYIETSEYLGDWTAEYRAHCYYSNYCYFHGELDVLVREIKNDPGKLKISFEGKAKEYMDYRGRFYSKRVRVGSSWHDGELIVSLDDVNSALFSRYVLERVSIFEPRRRDDRAGPAGCRWVEPTRVNEGRSGD